MIDLFFAIILVMAIIKGYSKGLIVAIFSFVGFLIGLSAALKLSSTVANWLQSSTNISTYWLPFISFALVIIGVVLLIRVGAKMIEKAIQIVLLGWVNKLGGILLYVGLYTSLLSVLLFYCNKMNIIKVETFTTSKTYPFIEPFAPKIINAMSIVLPFLKDTLESLTHFFDKFSNK